MRPTTCSRRSIVFRRSRRRPSPAARSKRPANCGSKASSDSPATSAKVRDELDTAGAGQEVIIVCQTEAEIERLREIFGGTRLAAEGKLGFVVGRLHAGFRLVARRLVLVSGNELFHRSDLNRPSAAPAQPRDR